MKRYIDSDERYPDYSLLDCSYANIDIPDDFIARYDAAVGEYEAVQTILRHNHKRTEWEYPPESET